MIKKIGIENFRVFKDYTEFELAPLTVLTGPNSSGKSSFIKLILLFKNGINKLNFNDRNIHNLESFEKCLNWLNEEDVLKIKIFGENEFIEFIYQNSMIRELSFNEDGFLFKYRSIGGSKYEFNNIMIKKIIDDIYKVDFKTSNSKEVFERLFRWKLDSNLGIEKELKHLKEELLNVNRDGLLFELVKGDIVFTEKFSSQMLGIQEELFENVVLEAIDPYSQNPVEKLDFFINFRSHLNSLGVLVKSEFHFRLVKELNIDFSQYEITYSKLGKLIFDYDFDTQLTQQDGKHFKINLIHENYVRRCDLIIEEFEALLDSIFYISPRRGGQKRVLSNRSDNEIDLIIRDYAISGESFDKNFIQDCFSIIKLNGELKIERYEGEISLIYIKQGDRLVNLADVGFGYSQIVPIIIQIYNLHNKYGIDKSSPISLIIEEPEANLHPNLQSKLADVLVLAYKTYGIHFILETHSEYLIRKLQYLTANKEITTEDINIYYFNEDEYVNEKEKKVKKININTFGGLTDSFGPGFYDEATKLQFELLRINKGQNN
ncbi:DUF3696 domain-containing protein [Namhaeicola litoreus]|uniref:DUF3696 domain-containing protein n=1 Tax=Namhaeicola litoreus TaxID=1052145 RepID=A0ABW3Y1B3_9FLAO